MSTILQTRDLSKSWRGMHALRGVDFSMERGARHALIGPNGAGKTTFINVLTGVFAPTAGEVMLAGERITGLAQYQRVKRGVTRTFQINTLFPGLTVLESVLIAICEHRGTGAQITRTVSACREEIGEALDILRSLQLESQADTLTRNLPYGHQRLLEIALALATRPSVLLLDEPAAGIPSNESRQLFEVIARLPASVSVLFIEHDMDLVFRFAERISVLVAGTILVEGTPQQIAADPRVREIYLGEAVHA